MSNDIKALRAALFDTIDRVKTGELDTDKARAIVGVSQTLVNLAKIEFDYIKEVGGTSEFMEPAQQLPAGIAGVKRHKLAG